MNNATAAKSIWADFLKLFGTQNHLRPTRLGVFVREGDVLHDYWLEDGLPLSGIALEMNGENSPTIEIMLGDKSEATNGHYTHSIQNVRQIKFELTLNSENDGLEITDAEGKITVLRLETF